MNSLSLLSVLFFNLFHYFVMLLLAGGCLIHFALVTSSGYIFMLNNLVVPTNLQNFDNVCTVSI